MVQTSFAQRYSFKHYGPDEGLKTAVSRLLQDQDGFLWVGTANGLFRYDGDRFQRFSIADGLPSASIRYLHQSANGTLWVVTSGGLARLRRNRFERVVTGRAEEPEALVDMDSDHQGLLYVSSNMGLLLGEPAPDGEFRFHFAQGAPKVPVRGVHVEPDVAVWFGCGSKLCRLAGGRNQVFGHPQELPDEQWSAILIDRQGNLWVRGLQRLFVRQAGTEEFIARDAGLPQSSNSAVDLVMDRAGVALISTDLGLARWVDGGWALVGSAEGLESDTVSSVLQDREGSVWIGLWGAGLARWLGYGEWVNWTKADGLGNNIVWAMRRQLSGAILVGTDNGLVRMDERGRFKPAIWTKKDGLGGNKVKAIAIGADGAAWIGTLPGGISRLDPVTERIRTYGAASGLTDEHVIALHIDPQNRLWVSTSGGLFRSTPLDGTVRFEKLIPPATEGHELYFRFLGDKRGRVWVGSMAGLFCWFQGRWTRFTTADGLKSNAATHVAETPDGAIWIGYREPLGLSRLTFPGGKPHVDHYTTAEGLGSDYILFLGLDSRGNLWAGTDDGVDVRKGGEWEHFSHDDGLVWDDCAANGFLAEPDGTIWIGTLKGLSRYRRASGRPASVNVPAILTSVRFGEKPADPAAFATIPFRDHSFFITFAGLTFRGEKDVVFRSRLVGLDDVWTETRQRQAHYPSLSPGPYRFEVMVRNADGVWSSGPAQFSFRILPQWWQTWWFRSLTFAAMAFVLWLIWLWRVESLVRRHKDLAKAVLERTFELQTQRDLGERQKGEIEQLLKKSQDMSRLKSEFLANMSHEIRTPMNGVMGMTQLALATSLDDEQREYVTTIGNSAESLLTIINDILDFSKAEAGKFELASEPFALRDCLSSALRTVALKAHEKGLELAWRVQPDVPDRLRGDAGKLRQIILNLVGNAIKFTARGEIALEISREPESIACADGSSSMLRFSVHDTGIGIDPEKRAMIFEAFAQIDGSRTRKYGGTGLGLAISSQLVILMNGQIWVDSSPDEGSTFHFLARFEIEEPTPPLAPIRALPSDALALLVDDNGTSRRFLKEILADWRIEARTAGTGDKALAALDNPDREGRTFQLAIVDSLMPGEDTFDLVRRMKERAPALAFIVLTSTGHNQDNERFRGLGIESYVAKPVNPAELYDRIAAVSGEAAQAVAKQPPAGAIAQSSRSYRILVADDNLVNRRVALRILQKMGHDVVLAENGRQVIETVKKQRFDLILMDVQMPEMDGFEATSALRNDEKRQRRGGGSGPGIPIVAMTAHAMSGDRELCLSAGMDDYLAKPIDAGALAAVIEKLCAGKVVEMEQEARLPV